MSEQKKQIPDRYIQFCKDVAELAIKYELNSVGMRFTPGYSENYWRSDIVLNWEQGRHGEDSRRLNISSTVALHEKIDWPKEQK